MKPIVAVVGRPNVGKSTLVNRLAQTSDAIVHESRGVTRDRSYHTADWNGREFTIVDTGGIEPLKSDDVFATSIRDQALAAAEEAAVILFVVDGRTGVTEEDESVARMLKRCDKPVFLLVNKLDNPDRENDSIWEFYSLGIGEPTPLSALHGHGTGDLLDDIVALLPEEEDEVADEFPDALNVAIIGRPNAGKSSLFNRILGADRSIVSNIAGTTRDAIDTVVERNGKHYRMVDTAGIRKKSTVYENIEYYSMVRGLRAIDRADVALLVVDASVGVTEQDQKVMGLAIERGCAIVVLLNKWDLLDDDRKREACMETIDRRLGVMAPWAQYLRISALTGRSVEKIWATGRRRRKDTLAKDQHLAPQHVPHRPARVWPYRDGRQAPPAYALRDPNGRQPADVYVLRQPQRPGQRHLPALRGEPYALNLRFCRHAHLTFFRKKEQKDA